MKITDFLKRHSLINSKFIDDFYSFYDDGKNEYDYTIDLDKLAFWLEVRKDHLKTLLESNFSENDDYIILDKQKNGKGMGIGKNNVKTVMLRYTCAKELCMISRSEKSSVIRKFYIDLEKLLITYKDYIVAELTNQLNINVSNKEIIQQNKKKGLIYVLKIDDSDINNTTEPMEVKIGQTRDLEARIKQYNVGRVNELPIVLVYLTDDIDEIEQCLKDNLNRYRMKKNANTEIFKIDVDFIKETIKYCSIKSLLLKQNKKLLNKKDNQEYVIIIDRENISDANLFLEPMSKKKISKKKTSRKTSKKKISRKTSKKKISKKNKLTNNTFTFIL